MRRLASWMVTVSLFVFAAAVAETPRVVLAGEDAHALSDLVKRVRPSVLLLTTFNASGDRLKQATGFAVEPGGRIVTNHHVLVGASRVTAKTVEGLTYEVEGVLADDSASDVAILKLSFEPAVAARIPPLKLSSVAPEVGARIVIVGNPLGLEGTLSEGIISAIRDAGGVLQVSAPISPGSSGSPVFGLHGEVVGVAVATRKDGQALNFAIPTSVVARLLGSAALVPRTIASSWEGDAPPADDPWDSPEYAAAKAARGQGSTWMKAALRLVDRFPEFWPGHYMLGRAYSDLGLLEEAAAAIRQAIKLNPEDDVCWSTLMSVRRAQRDTAGAEAAVREAIRLAELSTERRSKAMLGIYLKNLGEILEETGLLDEAGEALRKAVALDPRAYAWLLLAEVEEKRGESLASTHARERYVSLAEADSWLDRALVLEREGSADGAVAAASRAVALNPGLVAAWAVTVRVQRVRGKMREAVDAAARLVVLARSSWPAVAIDALEVLGLERLSEDPVRPTFTLDPVVALALAEETKQRLGCEMALPAYRWATFAEPAPLPEAWFGEGACAYETMRWDLSARAFTAYLAVRPKAGAGWQRLALALGRGGKIDEAFVATSRLRPLDPSLADAVEGWLKKLPR